MSRWTSEWFLLRRDRTAWLIYAVFATVSTLAALDSVQTFARDARLLHELRAEEAGRLHALHQALAAPPRTPPPSWDDPANPGAVGRAKAATYALLPVSATNVVRARPGAAAAVSVSSEGGALDRALGPLGQPRVMSLGRFNLGFLIIVVLPLFVLLISFDLVAGDHESGVARLLLAHEARPRLRYLVRAALRVCPLVAIVWLAVAAAVAFAGPLSRPTLAGLAATLALVVLSATFWTSISLFVQARLHKSTASGVAGLASWALFVILIPTLLSVASEITVPIPSRIERTSRGREELRRASIEVAGVLSRYLEDHPELASGQTKVEDYYVRRVATDAAVAAARAPVEQAFFRALDRQRQLVALMASASPVSLVAMMLDEIAGESDTRSDRFRHEVDAFQRRFATFFNERTMRGERLTSRTLQQRPRFHFVERPLTVWPLLVLAVWTLLALTLAILRLPRTLEQDPR